MQHTGDPFGLTRAQWVSRVLLMFAVLVLYGAAGRIDMADERQQAENYCAKVRSGTWPDYRGTYRDECVPDVKKRKKTR